MSLSRSTRTSPFNSTRTAGSSAVHEATETDAREQLPARWKEKRLALLSRPYNDELKKECDELEPYVEEGRITSMYDLLEWSVRKEETPLYLQAAEDFPTLIPTVPADKKDILEVLGKHDLPYSLQLADDCGEMMKHCLENHSVHCLTASYVFSDDVESLCQALPAAKTLKEVSIFRATSSVNPENLLKVLAACPAPIGKLSLPEFQHGSNGSLGQLLYKEGLVDITIKCEDSMLLSELVQTLTKGESFKEAKHICIAGASSKAISQLLLSANQRNLTLTFITTEAVVAQCTDMDRAVAEAPKYFAGIEFQTEYSQRPAMTELDAAFKNSFNSYVRADTHYTNCRTVSHLEPQDAKLLCQELAVSLMLDEVDIHSASDSVDPERLINALANCPSLIRKVSLPEFKTLSLPEIDEESGDLLQRESLLDPLLYKEGLCDITIKCEDSVLLIELLHALERGYFVEAKHISIEGAPAKAIMWLLQAVYQPLLTLTFITTDDVLAECESINEAIAYAPNNFASVEFRAHDYQGLVAELNTGFKNASQAVTGRRRVETDSDAEFDNAVFAVSSKEAEARGRTYRKY